MSRDQEAFYVALTERNPDYEGVFFVGIRTTGVFCRPTCPARPPKRENCEFFPDAQQAMLASYRPCQRCRPLSNLNGATDVVRLLVEAVEREPDRRWRAADFGALDVHASTVRRQFRRQLGMTFVEYTRARRLGAAFKAMQAGKRVITAQLDAGYESASGFRDAFTRLMGAPPTGRAARVLYAAWLDTPLGSMVAIGDDEALYLLDYSDRRGLERQVERLRARTGARIVAAPARPIAQIEADLGAYFDGRSVRFETPLARLGSEFQNAVWDALLVIPPGETRSYADIARVVGRPRAVRAAAQANRANPFAIVIPCHRVINADGALGGYGGGLARKRWLLNHEQRLVSAALTE